MSRNAGFNSNMRADKREQEMAVLDKCIELYFFAARSAKKRRTLALPSFNRQRQPRIEEVRFAADSPLEESGFEPSVPRKAPGVPAVPALVRAVFRLEGSRRNRWFESGSLQQRVRTKPLTPRA